MAPSFWAPLPNDESLKDAAERFAREGRIDPLDRLAGARVWLFSGTEDRTVARPVVDALARFYSSMNAPPVLVADKPAGHAMVTEAAGNACGTTRTPFINACDYDAAGELLKHLLGPLSLPSAAPEGRVVAFDQKAFAGGAAHAIGIADAGYAYVPHACETGRLPRPHRLPRLPAECGRSRRALRARRGL